MTHAAKETLMAKPPKWESSKADKMADKKGQEKMNAMAKLKAKKKGKK